MSRNILALVVAGSLLGLTAVAPAAAQEHDSPVPPRQKWSFSGPFGTLSTARSSSAASRSTARSARSATA